MIEESGSRLTDLDPHHWCYVLYYYSGCIHRSVLSTSPVLLVCFSCVQLYIIFLGYFSCNCYWLFRPRAEVKCSSQWPIGKREYMLIFKGRLTRCLLTDPIFCEKHPDRSHFLSPVPKRCLHISVHFKTNAL
jgi:hypothetical protein